MRASNHEAKANMTKKLTWENTIRLPDRTSPYEGAHLAHKTGNEGFVIDDELYVFIVKKSYSGNDTPEHLETGYSADYLDKGIEVRELDKCTAHVQITFPIDRWEKEELRTKTREALAEALDECELQVTIYDQ